MDQQEVLDNDAVNKDEHIEEESIDKTVKNENEENTNPTLNAFQNRFRSKAARVILSNRFQDTLGFKRTGTNNLLHHSKTSFFT